MERKISTMEIFCWLLLQAVLGALLSWFSSAT